MSPALPKLAERAALLTRGGDWHPDHTAHSPRRLKALPSPAAPRRRTAVFGYESDKRERGGRSD